MGHLTGTLPTPLWWEVLAVVAVLVGVVVLAQQEAELRGYPDLIAASAEQVVGSVREWKSAAGSAWELAGASAAVLGEVSVLVLAWVLAWVLAEEGPGRLPVRATVRAPVREERAAARQVPPEREAPPEREEGQLAVPAPVEVLLVPALAVGEQRQQEEAPH